LEGFETLGPIKFQFRFESELFFPRPYRKEAKIGKKNNHIRTQPGISQF